MKPHIYWQTSKEELEKIYKLKVLYIYDCMKLCSLYNFETIVYMIYKHLTVVWIIFWYQTILFFNITGFMITFFYPRGIDINKKTLSLNFSKEKEVSKHSCVSHISIGICLWLHQVMLKQYKIFSFILSHEVEEPPNIFVYV